MTSRVLWMNLILGVVCIVALVVAVAALMGVLPATAAVIISTLGVLVAVAVAYITNFRGPEIRLKLAPSNPFAHRLASGYSSGLPSTWSIVVNLLASNDGPQPGALAGFGVDSAAHFPRAPKSFEVTFSELEWQKPPARHVNAYSYPLPLPLLLPPQAREKVLFRAMLTFTGSPSMLANDLRELKGARVRFHYNAGTEDKPKQRTGEVSLNYDEVRSGVRSYWQGAQQYHAYVKQLDGVN
jgi:hypothetical protein